MLNVKNIRVCYEDTPAIHDVSFKIEKGELVSIVGANGAGKTTLLRTIIGSLHPDKGKVEFEGIDISHKPVHEIVTMGICYVPEGREIFGTLSVEDNLLLGAYVLKDKEQIKSNIEYAFKMFPRLKKRRKQQGNTLSGGEQQMLAIARGLMSKPKLLMLDEPSLGLMPKLVSEVLEIVKELSGHGSTILLVEQNIQEALELTDRAYILQNGETISEGTGEEILKSDIIKKAFLGL